MLRRLQLEVKMVISELLGEVLVEVAGEEDGTTGGGGGGGSSSDGSSASAEADGLVADVLLPLVVRDLQLVEGLVQASVPERFKACLLRVISNSASCRCRTRAQQSLLRCGGVFAVLNLCKVRVGKHAPHADPSPRYGFGPVFPHPVSPRPLSELRGVDGWGEACSSFCQGPAHPLFCAEALPQPCSRPFSFFLTSSPSGHLRVVVAAMPFRAPCTPPPLEHGFAWAPPGGRPTPHAAGVGPACSSKHVHGQP
jgi:hypothetical protein